MEKGSNLSSGSLENLSVFPKLDFYCSLFMQDYLWCHQCYFQKSLIVCLNPLAPILVLTFWSCWKMFLAFFWSKLRKNLFFRTCFKLYRFQIKWKITVKRNLKNWQWLTKIRNWLKKEGNPNSCLVCILCKVLHNFIDFDILKQMKIDQLIQNCYQSFQIQWF